MLLMSSLRWRHNDHAGVSNHQPHGYLFNRVFRRISKKTSKLRVTGLCAGNSPGPVNSPHKGPVTRKMFPFDDVIMGDARTSAASTDLTPDGLLTCGHVTEVVGSSGFMVQSRGNPDITQPSLTSTSVVSISRSPYHQYKKSYCRRKTVLWPSFLQHETPHSKMT